MKIKSIILFCCLYTMPSLFAQIPAGYYDSAAGLNGSALQTALHNIIKNHTVIPYSNLYAAFDSTDIKPDSSVWDMYSDIPGGTPPYKYYYTATWECGNYNSEGDCFNREHSWPQSWFNGISPAYSDLFHIFPTDGYVNNRRSNYPYGEVSNATWTAMNGGKLGPNTTTGYALTVLEPIDEYKGDIARGYFYMSTRYFGEDTLWGSSDAVTKAVIEPWEICLLLSWHQQDSVSSKEINRNNAIYKLQNNRNPFIDRPGLADSVFQCSLAGIHSLENSPKISVFPNPCSEKLTVTFSQKISKGSLQLLNSLGEEILSRDINNSGEVLLNISGFPKGIYILSVNTATYTTREKLIVE